MKMKIKYMRVCEGLDPLQILPNGEWIDLRTAEDVTLKKGEFKLIPLGVRIKLPAGFEAPIIPRSGTYGKHKVIMTNSMGLIDNTYCGKDDVWRFPALAMEDTTIKKNTRICQFRIQPSQFAGPYVKKKWLEVERIELVEEEWLTGGEESRGGFGSTGVD